MSAADKILNKKPVLGHLITFVLMLIVTITAHALSVNRDNNKDLSEDVKKNTLKLESKPDKAYVDNRVKEEVDKAIDDHEKVDAARYQGISDMFILIQEQQTEMRQDIKELLKNSK